MIKKIWGSVLLLGSILFTTACTHTIPDYGQSTSNLESLKKLTSSKSKISVKPFKTSLKDTGSITCRAAGPVKAPNGMTFEQYINKALVAELETAGMYTERAGNKISGTLTFIDFSSGISDANWKISMRFQVNGKIINVTSVHPFSASWIADSACTETAHAFIPATQKLLNKLFRSKKFRAALN